MLWILAIPHDQQSAFMHLARSTPPPDARPAPSPPIRATALDLDTLPGQTLKGYELRECLGRGDREARLWDAQTGKELRQLVGHTDIIWGVAFSPDRKYILTGSQDKTARLWDTQTDQELRRFTGHTAIV